MSKWGENKWGENLKNASNLEFTWKAIDCYPEKFDVTHILPNLSYVMLYNVNVHCIISFYMILYVILCYTTLTVFLCYTADERVPSGGRRGLMLEYYVTKREGINSSVTSHYIWVRVEMKVFSVTYFLNHPLLLLYKE